MKCATCHKESEEVKRIIIDAGYDKTLAKAIYNCPSCYEKKIKARKNTTTKQ